MGTRPHHPLPTRILVVDDEPSIRNLLDRVLRQAGYQVSSAASGNEGMDMVNRENPNLIILDLNLPDLSGEDVCQRIRQTPRIQSTPVMILTGRNNQGLSTQCLNDGADDYLSKPFDIPELVAHVRALLRRPPLYASEDAVIKRRRISVLNAERQVFWDNRLVDDLAPKEFEILRLLLLHTPRVVTKNALALKVWGIPIEQINQRTVDVHVRRIRQKIGAVASRNLKTIPCVGYQWLDKPEAV
jgi:DNA-binding response OmpR family regulator